MAFKTRITEMLGIEHPIVQGGMQGVGYAELASAVSNAGGLGTLTALTQPSPDALRDEIERCRSMTSKPFAMNITVLPTILPPDYKAYAQAIIESGIKIVETAGTPEVREIWAMMKPHGITILHNAPPFAMRSRPSVVAVTSSPSTASNVQAIPAKMTFPASF